MPELIVAPDPYSAVIPHLRSVLNGVEVGVTKPADIGTGFVWVRRIGGRNENIVLDQIRLDFIVFADTNRLAIAELARGNLKAMAGRTFSGVQIYGVGDFMLPSDLPDPSNSDDTVTMFTLEFGMRLSALDD